MRESAIRKIDPVEVDEWHMVCRSQDYQVTLEVGFAIEESGAG